VTRVLGIESSCDETGVAVVEDRQRVAVNLVASQVEIHAEFGGVVPEIASRQHMRVISQLTQEAMGSVDGKLDAIAVTNGPGLMGSLLVGVNFAKALAYSWRVPLVPVHHIEGHIFSPFLNDGGQPEFPALALIVSGGHTQLIQCSAPYEYCILGTTRDDAIGESFDKVARLLELPYPGGPSIQRCAETGDPDAIRFPRAFEKTDTLEFSYSGLKTAVLYETRKNTGASQSDVAASFQNAAVDALMIKTKLALRQTNAPRLIVAGGVAANALLRLRLESEIDVPLLLPALEYCGDNGAMIAAAGHSRLESNLTGGMDTTPNSRLAL
jgi:N6-L-threonylcarbamoyladenine synthase